MMAADNMDFSLPKAGGTSAQPELLVSSVLHLMSHYTAGGNHNGAAVKLACAIERHLKALADLPHLTPVLRATCRQLSEQWAAIVERALPPPEKNSLFVRLMQSRPINSYLNNCTEIENRGKQSAA